MLAGLAAAGCAPAAVPPAEPAATKAATSPAPPQAGYCERLQPLLDKAVAAARIGTELKCLDVPNVTGLGWYGPPGAGEEASVADCFDETKDYESLLHPSDSSFDLDIDEAFSEDTKASAGVRLAALVPWLPKIEGAAANGSRLTARVAIRGARFVTVVGLGSRLVGQRAEQRCLTALCRSDYSYVQKALIGTPSVTVEARDESGKSLAIDAAAFGAGFAHRALSSGGHELTSDKPVTLAIARSPFRSALTDRLCDFCGRQGQSCCQNGPGCDGGLGCVGGRCVSVGGPGEPCDSDKCSGGSVCVAGVCQLSCGGRGQPCCADSGCSGKLKCIANPDNALEYRLASEELEVTGGFFGTDEDRMFGTASCGTLKSRARMAVTRLGAGRGNCDKSWWLEPKNEKDCRIAVHFEVSPFSSVHCRVETFVFPPRKPDVCQ